MPELILVPSVWAVEETVGLRLDDKMCEGVSRHAAYWPGPVRVILRRGQGTLPFSRVHAPGDLDFRVELMDEGQPFDPAQFRGAAMVLGAADDHRQIPLARICAAAGVPLVYAIEYTLKTRMDVERLSPGRNWSRRARTMFWLWRQERPRRRAMAAAAGLQANGYPAEGAYAGLSPAPMLYLDNRMDGAMMASPAEMEARVAHHAAAGPLRLIHSGRLEPMKGSGDLLPIIQGLSQRGVDFTLDIYGTGSLEPVLLKGIAAAGLTDRVRLHKPVPFETELVPISRGRADIFVSCHRQSDPSCTYVEAMGCGLPVIGYDNGMWARLARESGAGWVLPMGDTGGMATRLAALAADRPQVLAHARAALDFARARDFDHEFKARMDHLKGLAGL
ncbi:MAG: glycosyltransferase [Paracoccus sp. (in: a-proteobacteria)]